MIDSHEIEWSSKMISRLWGYYASNPSYIKQYFSYHSGKYILKYLNKQVTLRNKRILDFGCGPGYLIENLINIYKGEVCGLDFSKESILKVNQRFNGRSGFINAEAIDKLPSSFKDNYFDVVICVEVIEHLKDKELNETLREIYRVLKPAGCVMITTPNQEDLSASKTLCPECGCVFHRWQHIRVWDAKSLKQTVKESGFKSVHVRDAVFGSYPRRLFYFLNKIISKECIYPRLVCIAKK